MIKLLLISLILSFYAPIHAAVVSNTVSVEGKLIAIEKATVTLEDIKTQKRFLVPRNSITHLSSHITGRSIVTAHVRMSNLLNLNKIQLSK